MRVKLRRFKEITERRNVIEPEKEIYENIKGKWHDVYFQNSNPITLELACGNGEYSVGLAEIFQERNFIGVDIKGERIWNGSTYAKENNLDNVAFLRAQIDHLGKFFEKEEVEEIWIVFPDPQPRESDERKRLTHPKFINIYKEIVKPGGLIHFKTDNRALFDYSLELLRQRNDITGLVFTHDLYNSEWLPFHHNIRTKYEQKFLAQGFKINYMQFRIT